MLKNQLTSRTITAKKQYAELNALTSCALDLRISDLKKYYTVRFQYPPAGYYYTALTTYTFKELICDWIGDIHNCNIVYSWNYDEPFLSFSKGTPISPP